MVRRKLTMNEAGLLRGMYKELGYTQYKLASLFGITQSVVWDIITNTSYTNPLYDPVFIPDTPLRRHFEKNKEKFGCDTFDEAYKPIKDYPAYMIGREGSIFSSVGYHWIQLSSGINSQGYVCVSINQKPTLLHRLLAEAFLPNPNNFLCVLHSNDCKICNNIKNLRWGTHKDNDMDAQRNGKKNTILRATKEYVVHLKHQNPELSESKIAKECGIARSAVHKLLKQSNCKLIAV